MSDASRALLLSRIEEIRVQRDLDDDQLVAAVEAAGLNRATFRDLRKGITRDPSLGVLIRVARGLGLRSIEELITPLGTMELLRVEFGPDIVR